jgi:hypothetical protein
MSRNRWLVVIALPLVAVALLLTTRGGGSPPASAASLGAPCATPVDQGVLPVWARTGFSDKLPRMPHVLGRADRIAAILWDQMVVPSDDKHGNKILWVSRVPVQALSDLRISAQRMDAHGAVGKPVSRVVVGGPGPSGVDLPVAGCWRMTLRWSGHTDTLDLPYVVNAKS